jgi:hypothetical protein
MAGHAGPPAVGPWTEFGIGWHLANDQLHVAAPVRVGLLEPETRIAKRHFGGWKLNCSGRVALPV